jgi:branched-chain amino acid aminotransferase
MLWLDGAIFPDSRAAFDLSDRGLLLGDGAFDTALVLNGRIFRGDAHLRRLLGWLAMLGIDADATTIREAIAALIPHGERHVLRVTVTRGPGLRGLIAVGEQRPTIMASLASLPMDFFSPRLSMSVAAIRRNETSPLSRMKALCYLDAILAMGEAIAVGHNEALFLNCAGRVACASIGNVFAIFGKELVTPPLDDGVTPGIIRGFILAESGALGLATSERSIGLEEFCAADAVFMTNSLRLIAPVERIGAIAISEKGGKIVEALQQLLWRAIAAECGSLVA